MKIKIEKRIPIPDRSGNRATGIAAVIRKLEIGDSFQCNARDCTNAQQTQYRHNVKLTVRKIGDDLYRVWRVK